MMIMLAIDYVLHPSQCRFSLLVLAIVIVVRVQFERTGYMYEYWGGKFELSTLVLVLSMGQVCTLRISSPESPRMRLTAARVVTAVRD